MDRIARDSATWPGAVAVSGGGDSVALMHLLADWCEKARLHQPVVLTVDHGLRPQSGADARKVIRWAKAKGLDVHCFTWSGVKPNADIEAEARAARYRLMGRWLADNAVNALYLAHTSDDQAETFLIRLARGSGLDGLSAMRPVSSYPLPGHGGVSLVRPLLGFGRERLRAYLSRRGQPWLEDPMNADPRFSRARVRAAWPALEALGLSKQRLTDAASHLGRARAALDEVTLAVLRRACRIENGVAYLDIAALAAAPNELGLRALAGVLMAISGHGYRPRFEQLERLFLRIVHDEVGGGCTLHGCRIGPAPRARAVFGPGTLEVKREKPRGTA